MAYRDGLAQLNQRISGLRAAVDAGEQAQAELETISSALTENEEKVSTLAAERDRATSVARRYQGNGIRSLFFKLIGTHAKRLARAEKVLAEVTAAHEEASGVLEADVATHEALQLAVEDADRAREQLAALRNEKETWLSQNGGPVADELAGRLASIGQIEALGSEIDQAVDAGRKAQLALASVARSLGSAKGWGTFDMLGGGLIATAVKHSKIDKARHELGHAQAAIANFQRESKEVQLHLATAVEIDSFSTFADYFFDGIIFDWAVQSKISRSQESVKEASRQVVAAIKKLNLHRTELLARLEAAQRERAELVERWGA